MKKILVIQPIHEAGIELLKSNPNYEFEVVENIVNAICRQTSRKPMDARTMSAGDFGFLRHFLTCLSFVRTTVWLCGASFGSVVVEDEDIFLS